MKARRRDGVVAPWGRAAAAGGPALLRGCAVAYATEPRGQRRPRRRSRDRRSMVDRACRGREKKREYAEQGGRVSSSASLVGIHGRHNSFG
jgi:hypothetical protein